jgi:hypothetical protein
MKKNLGILFIFFIITNAYSQKKNCSSLPFYMSGDRIIYTDSTIINGVTI